jgi:hypothetical protein
MTHSMQQKQQTVISLASQTGPGKQNKEMIKKKW